MKLQVTIPCYNESKNIPLLLERFRKILNRNDVGILLVDNGSTDNSPAIIRELVPNYPFAESIRVERNQGYGFGILSGLRHSKSEYLGWTHADMQTDPFDILRGLEILESANQPQNVYVKGLRRGRPFFDEFFTFGMSIFESIYLGASLWDINGQPNLFHRSFFEVWEKPPSDFSLDLYAIYTAKVKDMEVIRFPVEFPPRVHGESSWNNGFASKWKFIKRTIDFSLKLKKGL